MYFSQTRFTNSGFSITVAGSCNTLFTGTVSKILNPDNETLNTRPNFIELGDLLSSHRWFEVPLGVRIRRPTTTATSIIRGLPENDEGITAFQLPPGQGGIGSYESGHTQGLFSKLFYRHRTNFSSKIPLEGDGSIVILGGLIFTHYSGTSTICQTVAMACPGYTCTYRNRLFRCAGKCPDNQIYGFC